MTAPTDASRDDWALALARFVHCLRPDWDVPGVRTAIHAARNLDSREGIAHALIALTRRDELRTPALLSSDGPHWHTGRTPDTRVEPARCTTHPHEQAANCRACAVERFGPTRTATLTLSPAQVARNARGARLVRDAIAGRATFTGPDPQSLAAHDIPEEEDR